MGGKLSEAEGRRDPAAGRTSGSFWKKKKSPGVVRKRKNRPNNFQKGVKEGNP